MTDITPLKKINWFRENDSTIRIVERGSKGKRWPRAECRPFDTYSDEQLEGWTQNYNAKLHIQSRGIGVSEKTSALIGDWEVYLSNQGKNRETVSEKVKHAYRAAEYFEGLAENIKLWPQHSIDLVAYLLKKGFSPLETAKTQNNTRSFWKWLRTHKRLVAGELDLDQVVGYAIQNTTPLKFSVTPQQVLDFVKHTPIFEFKVAALVAFFGGLRPQEIYALKRSHFFTKDVARNSESGQVMASIGLYNGLVINVCKSRGKKVGEIGNPKKLSFGIVAVWSHEAAKALVPLIAQMDPDKPLFNFTNSYYQQEWREHGFPGLILRDLRRAGVYHLGNFTQIKMESLKNWARHKKVSTTALYFRQPYAPPTEIQDVLELDDVS